jgi:hypothetical protein
LSAIRCRIRYYKDMAFGRKQEGLNHRLTITVTAFRDGYSHGSPHIMLSLTEAIIYLGANPTARLTITEQLEAVRTDPTGATPDKAWPWAGSSLNVIERDGVQDVTMGIGPFHEVGKGGQVFDFSRIPHEDVGGRWPVETQDVVFDR